MAHKKGQGSSRNGRDSNSQRLGVKAHDGNLVSGGTIIVRQRGRRFQPGLNAGRGKDDTIFAKVAGRSGSRTTAPADASSASCRSSRPERIWQLVNLVWSLTIVLERSMTRSMMSLTRSDVR